MYSDSIAFFVFSAGTLSLAAVLIWTYFSQKRNWLTALALFGFAVTFCLSSTFLLLGRARPVIDLPLWSVDLERTGLLVMGGVIVDDDSAYLMLQQRTDKGDGVTKLFFFDEDPDLIKKLKQAMSEMQRVRGTTWGFSFTARGDGKSNGLALGNEFDFVVPDLVFTAPPKEDEPARPENQFRQNGRTRIQ